MYKSITFVILALALCSAYPYADESVDIVVDNNGQEFYLIPINEHHDRVRRDTTIGAGPGGVRVSDTRTIVNNDKHKFDITSYAERNYHPKGPLTTGNQFDYTYKPSASTFSLQNQNTRGQGTDAAARGTYNFFQTQDKRGTVGVSGQYSRHYGGLQGTGRPDYGVFLHGTYRI